MPKPEDNRYRLQLFRAFARSDAETRNEIRTDLQHQRRLDILFYILEVVTVAFGTSLAAGVLVLAFILGLDGHATAATWTAVGDTASVAGYLVRRSYFVAPTEEIEPGKNDDDGAPEPDHGDDGPGPAPGELTT